MPGPSCEEAVATTDSVIALDGPGAVGKTTVGRLLARRLGFLFVDTGLMYRALTWAVMERGVDGSDEDVVNHIARDIAIEIVPPAAGGCEAAGRVLIDGADVAEQIKSPEVDRQVSVVSKHRGVREEMVARQRQLAARGKVVMVGRDIGTVVLPDAALKIYLTASVEERARRRYRELSGLGSMVDCSSILMDLKRRDRIDSNRRESPLRPASDSQLVDTTDLAPGEVVEEILQLWKSKDRLR